MQNFFQKIKAFKLIRGLREGEEVPDGISIRRGPITTKVYVKLNRVAMKIAVPKAPWLRIQFAWNTKKFDAEYPEFGEQWKKWPPSRV